MLVGLSSLVNKWFEVRVIPKIKTQRELLETRFPSSHNSKTVMTLTYDFKEC